MLFLLILINILTYIYFIYKIGDSNIWELRGKSKF